MGKEGEFGFRVAVLGGEEGALNDVERVRMVGKAVGVVEVGKSCVSVMGSVVPKGVWVGGAGAGDVLST